MGWVYVGVAIVCDVAGTYALARSDGFRRFPVNLTAVVLLLGALWMFALALTRLVTSVADAVFAAGGTAAMVAVGVLWLGERLTVRKVVALTLIVAGVVTLRMQGGHA